MGYLVLVIVLKYIFMYLYLYLYLYLYYAVLDPSLTTTSQKFDNKYQLLCLRQILI